MVDYINELREGCLEAYTGIVQGLKGDNERQINRKISDTSVSYVVISRVLEIWHLSPEGACPARRQCPPPIPT